MKGESATGRVRRTRPALPVQWYRGRQSSHQGRERPGYRPDERVPGGPPLQGVNQHIRAPNTGPPSADSPPPQIATPVKCRARARELQGWMGQREAGVRRFVPSGRRDRVPPSFTPAATNPCRVVREGTRASAPRRARRKPRQRGDEHEGGHRALVNSCRTPGSRPGRWRFLDGGGVTAAFMGWQGSLELGSHRHWDCGSRQLHHRCVRKAPRACRLPLSKTNGAGHREQCQPACSTRPSPPRAEPGKG